jgi:hypothetical protein
LTGGDDIEYIQSRENTNTKGEDMRKAMHGVAGFGVSVTAAVVDILDSLPRPFVYGGAVLVAGFASFLYVFSR